MVDQTFWFIGMTTCFLGGFLLVSFVLMYVIDKTVKHFGAMKLILLWYRDYLKAGNKRIL